MGEIDNSSVNLSNKKEAEATYNYESGDYLEEPLNIDLQCIKVEMDDIQNDLQELVAALNSLVFDSSQQNANDMEQCVPDVENEQQLNSLLIEDPQNKELRLINWTKFGPFIDNIVSDLHKLKRLNSRTNEVVRRIRNISVVNHLGSTGCVNIVDSAQLDEADINKLQQQES